MRGEHTGNSLRESPPPAAPPAPPSPALPDSRTSTLFSCPRTRDTQPQLARNGFRSPHSQRPWMGLSLEGKLRPGRAEGHSVNHSQWSLWRYTVKKCILQRVLAQRPSPASVQLRDVGSKPQSPHLFTEALVVMLSEASPISRTHYLRREAACLSGIRLGHFCLFP